MFPEISECIPKMVTLPQDLGLNTEVIFFFLLIIIIIIKAIILFLCCITAHQGQCQGEIMRIQ